MIWFGILLNTFLMAFLMAKISVLAGDDSKRTFTYALIHAVSLSTILYAYLLTQT